VAKTLKSLPKHTRYRRRLLAVGLSLMWALLIAVAQLAGAFQDFDRPLLDWRQSMPTEVPLGEPDLALISIDEIPTNRPWPWPRLEYAILLRSLLPYNPQGVVFEMLLHQRDTKVDAYDSRFAGIVDNMDDVDFVFAAAGLSQPPEDGAEPQRPANLEKIPEGSVDPGNMANFRSLLWPLEIFSGGSRVGLNNLLPNAKLQPRSVPLVFWVNGEIVPSLALQAAASRLDVDWTPSEIIMGDAIYMRDGEGKTVRTVPIDQEGRLLMRYRPNYPEPWRASFDNVPLYAQMAETGGEPEQNLREVKDRLIFVGRTDEKSFEPIPGVLGPTSDVEVQMLAARNILNADYIYHLPGWIVLPFYLLVGAAAGLFFFYYGPLPGLILLGVLFWSWEETALLAFRGYSLDMPMVSFGVMLLGIIPISFAAAHWGMRPVTRAKRPRPKFRAETEPEEMVALAERSALPSYAMPATGEAQQLGMGFADEMPPAQTPGIPGPQADPAGAPLATMELAGQGQPMAQGAPVATAEPEEEDVPEPDPDDFEKALARLAEIHDHIAEVEREEAVHQEKLKREENVRAAREALEEERKKREAERRERETKRRANYESDKVKLELKKKPGEPAKAEAKKDESAPKPEPRPEAKEEKPKDPGAEKKDNDQPADSRPKTEKKDGPNAEDKPKDEPEKKSEAKAGDKPKDPGPEKKDESKPEAKAEPDKRTEPEKKEEPKAGGKPMDSEPEKKSEAEAESKPVDKPSITSTPPDIPKTATKVESLPIKPQAMDKVEDKQGEPAKPVPVKKDDPEKKD